MTGRGLSAILAAPRRPMPAARTPSIEPLSAAARRVEEAWPGRAPDPEADREALVAEMRRRLETWDWDGATLRLACSAAYAVFTGDMAARRDLTDLRRFFLDEARTTRETALLGALFDAYLAGFAPKAGRSIALAEALSAAQDRLRARDRGLVGRLPDVLDPNRAHEVAADRMVDAAEPHAVLLELGFTRPRETGLMEHAHLAFIRRLAPRLHEPEVADRLIDWLRLPGEATARAGGAAEAITALLSTWTQADAGASTIERLTRRLVDLYGDPRRQTGEPWRSVGRAEHGLLLRWLTGENLKLLFDAISETTRDADESRMWSARRQFYLGLHEQKRIDAAWVAFADAGARQARAILARTGKGGAMPFGRQVAGGTRSNTSIMILRIGRKIIVDGSHSYKVHVFDETHPQAPRLFMDRYDCERIRIARPAPDARAHLGDWQGWVLQRI